MKGYSVFINIIVTIAFGLTIGLMVRSNDLMDRVVELESQVKTLQQSVATIQAMQNQIRTMLKTKFY